MLKWTLSYGPGPFSTHVGRGRHELLLPPDAEPMHAQVMPETDDGALCLWFLCRPTDRPDVPRRFLVAGTGEDVDGRYVWLATTGFREVVYHVFEIPKGAGW